jgi:myosin-crossreactive antigen
MIGNDGDLVYWLNHVQEELMDATNYIERILQELERIGDGSSLDFASLNAYRDSISLSMTSNTDFKIDESK